MKGSRRARSARRARRRPLLSILAAALGVPCALASLILGFLIFGEDIEGVVPKRWLVAFLVSSLVAVVVLGVAALTARRNLELGGRRPADDSRFLWGTILSLVLAGGTGLATALDDGFPAFLCLAGVLAAYVTLVRWTWWAWRAG